MSTKPPISARVRLISFLSTAHPPADCSPHENYWKLINQLGQVVEDIPQSDCVLVVFEYAVSDLGLACHNPVPNALRIKGTDLATVDVENL